MNGRQLPDLRYDGGRIRKLCEPLSRRDIFAVMLGTNDVLLTLDPDARTAVRKMEQFLRFLTEIRDKEGILIIAPPHIGGSSREAVKDPLYRRYHEESLKMNRGFAGLAEKAGIHFLDAADWDIELCFDLVHFSEAGHRGFAEKLGDVLADMMQDTGS